MTNQNVLFGGLPVNVAISTPVMNSGLGGGYQSGGCGSPAPAPAPQVPASCLCPLTPGNGIGAIQQGQNPMPIVALVPLPAFVAVVMGIGGVTVADVNVPAHRDVVLGVSLVSVAAGQVGSILWGGPVVNNINGTGGWNFVANEPVYIGNNGVLTQVPPATGWVQPVGFAISMNTVQLFPARAVPPSASLNAPVVEMVPFASNVVLGFDDADVFDLTLTNDSVLSFTGGIDGREITLRVTQGTVGGHLLSAGTNVIGLPTPANTNMNSRDVYKFQFDGANGQYICVSYLNIPA
jgi:hypothetical protein